MKRVFFFFRKTKPKVVIRKVVHRHGPNSKVQVGVRFAAR